MFGFCSNLELPCQTDGQMTVSHDTWCVSHGPSFACLSHITTSQWQTSRGQQNVADITNRTVVQKRRMLKFLISKPHLLGVITSESLADWSQKTRMFGLSGGKRIPTILWRATTLQRLPVDCELWPRDQRRHVAARACQNSYLLTGRRGLERIVLQTCCV